MSQSIAAQGGQELKHVQEVVVAVAVTIAILAANRSRDDER
jgi:hypothetical protein